MELQVPTVDEIKNHVKSACCLKCIFKFHNEVVVKFKQDLAFFHSWFDKFVLLYFTLIDCFHCKVLILSRALFSRFFYKIYLCKCSISNQPAHNPVFIIKILRPIFPVNRASFFFFLLLKEWFKRDLSNLINKFIVF